MLLTKSPVLMRKSLHFALLGILSLGFSHYGFANPLVVSSVCGAQSGTSAITVPFGCTTADGGTWSGTGFANYGTLGSTITLDSPTKGAGAPNTGVGVGYSDFLDFSNTGLASGTPVSIEFHMSVTGTLTFGLQDSGSVEFVLQPLLAVNGDTIINGGEGFAFCGPSSSCLGLSVIPTVKQSGTVLVNQAFLGTYNTTAGAASNLHIQGGFTNDLYVILGSATSDFFDPVSLTDIVVKDSNGHVIPGVTVVSDSGIVYPLNASAVPEPTSLSMVFIGVIAAILKLRSSSTAGSTRRWRW